MSLLDTPVLLINLDVLVNTIEGIGTSLALLKFLKDAGMKVFIIGASGQALKDEEAQIDAAGFFVVRLGMEDVVGQNTTQRCWVVDRDLANLTLAKTLVGRKCMTVMVGPSPIPRPVEIDTYISDLSQLVQLIFPQKM